MNAWEILGIEPTSDKKTIKRAYAKLLKQYHPEENPEKFKQIQAAYQQCLHSDQEIESVSYEQNIESKQDIKTQPKEFDILYFLAQNRGEVFTKE